MKIAVRYFTRSGNTEKLASRGSFAVMHRGRPNEQDEQDAAAFAKRVAGGR